jgi:hypothetical protein
LIKGALSSFSGVTFLSFMRHTTKKAGRFVCGGNGSAGMVVGDDRGGSGDCDPCLQVTLVTGDSGKSDSARSGKSDSGHSGKTGDSGKSDSAHSGKSDSGHSGKIGKRDSGGSGQVVAVDKW